MERASLPSLAGASIFFAGRNVKKRARQREWDRRTVGEAEHGLVMANRKGAWH